MMQTGIENGGTNQTKLNFLQFFIKYISFLELSSKLKRDQITSVKITKRFTPDFFGFLNKPLLDIPDFHLFFKAKFMQAIFLFSLLTPVFLYLSAN